MDGNRLVMVLGRSAAIGLALVTFLLVTLVFGGAVIAPVTVTLAVVLLGRPSNRPGLFATGLLATSLTFWFGAQAATDITAQGMGHLVVPEIALTSSSLVIALATWIAFALRLWRSSPNVSA